MKSYFRRRNHGSKQMKLLRSAILGFSLFVCSLNSHAKPVTYSQAVENPKLRQKYLDGLRKKIKTGCIKSITYDSDGKLKAALIRQLGSKNINPSAEDSELLKKDHCKKASAITLSRLEDLGDGKKRLLFVCPNSFSRTERQTIVSIKDHEGTHACDGMRGLVVQGKRFRYRDLKNVDKNILSRIWELRAYGNQLKASPRNEWGTTQLFTKTVFESLFITLMDEEMKLSLDKGQYSKAKGKSKNDKLKDIRKRFKAKGALKDKKLFIIRGTLLEYESFFRKVHSFMNLEF